MSERSMRTAVLAAALCAIPAGPAAASAVKVGEIESDRDCALYETLWGGWLVVECQEHFPEIRARIQSAIGESGALTLSTTRAGRDVPAPDYIVSGRISGLGSQLSHASARDYCVATAKLSASLDLRLRDARTGRVVHATTVTKSLETGSDVVAGRSSCSAASPGRASYGVLQREIALAAARALSFHLVPLRVITVDGNRIGLNYGAPLLSLGTLVQIESRGGPVKYRVAVATPQAAFAEPEGDRASISPGARASIIENDDPAANGRRFRKVDLPL